ncbi:hypothetical protein EB118_00335 [bacterium]|nr:hypothetical protein [bacterium]
MAKLRDNIQQQLPFISVLHYGDEEYVGIIINQDQHVTSFFDLAMIKNNEEKSLLLEVGEIWWWESNRQIPISIFCRKEVEPFKYAIKTFNSKDVRLILGPTVNLLNLTIKRVKRKQVQLIRAPKRI